MSGDGTNRILRTFIAIDIPPPVLHAIATTQEQLQAYLRAQNKDTALRWSPTRNLHLTLRFLGDTTPRQREQVAALLQEVVAKMVPFALRVDVSGRGLGGFPNLRQPRVVWMGLEGDLEKLGWLQSRVEEVAQAAGFEPEGKDYSPHLTLARGARDADRRALAQVGQAIQDYIQLLPVREPLTFQVDQIVFYQSEFGAGGSRYTPLAVLPFDVSPARP